MAVGSGKLHEVASVQRREALGLAARKAQAQQAGEATVGHLAHELLHPLEALAHSLRGEAAGGNQDQRVEHLLVQARGGGERVVPLLHCLRQAAAQVGLGLQPVQQVRHAQRHMASFVARSQPGNLSRQRIGGIGGQKVQQVDEAAFAQHRQQESGDGEVWLVQQALQRCLPACGGQGGLAAAFADAPGEHVDVPRLVGHLDGQRCLQFAVVRVDLAEEARRHQQRGVLVFDHVGHHLADGGLHLGRVREGGLPVQRGVGIPLRADGLGIQLGHVVGPDVLLAIEPEGEGRGTGFDPRAPSGQAPAGRGLRQHGAVLVRVGVSRVGGVTPAAGLGRAAGDQRRAARGAVPGQGMALGAAPVGQLGLPAGCLATHAQGLAGGLRAQRVLDQQVRAGVEA
jgi:hypothetical protein